MAPRKRARDEEEVCECSTYGCGSCDLPGGGKGRKQPKQTKQRHEDSDAKAARQALLAASVATAAATPTPAQPEPQPTSRDPSPDRDLAGYEQPAFEDHRSRSPSPRRRPSHSPPEQLSSPRPKSPVQNTSRSPSPDKSTFDTDEDLRIGLAALNAESDTSDDEDFVDEGAESESENEGNDEKSDVESEDEDYDEEAARQAATHPPDRQADLNEENVSYVDMSAYFHDSTASIPSPQLLVLILVVLLNLQYHLSRNGSQVLLIAIPFIVRAFFSQHSPGSLHNLSPTLSIPTSLVTARRQLFIDPVLWRFPVCKKCFFLHPIIDSSNSATFPTLCGHSRGGKSRRCNEPIVKRHENGRVEALKELAHQPLDAFIAQQLVRPGVEEIWAATAEKLRNQQDPMKSFFDGGITEEWRDERGRSMLELAEEEGVYTLFMMGYADWFNFAGNKHGGKSNSSGAHAYVFLNLPPDMIWKDENVYLADVFPGHREPNTDEINHVLRPTVDDLLLLWESNNGKGLFFNKTRLCRQGIFIRVVLVHLLGDLPAIRKMLACAGHSADKFPCPHCNLTSSEFHRCDIENWSSKTAEEWRQQANEYKNAWLIKDKNACFDKNGIRWTEYLRLPYFLPTLAHGIDPVHNLIMGVAKTHLRDNLGSDIKAPSFTRAERESLPLRSDEPSSFPSSTSDPSKSKHATGSTSSASTGTAGSAQTTRTKRKSVTTASSAKLSSIQKDQRNGSTQLERRTKRGGGTKGKQKKSSRKGKEKEVPKESEHGDANDSDEGEGDGSDEVEEHDQGSGDESRSKQDSSNNPMILGKKEIPSMQMMIKEMEVPQWIGRLPKRYGTAGAGSLKADQVRTLVQTVLLPYLAIRWNLTADDHGTRSYGIALGVYHLSSALTLLFRRSLPSSSLNQLADHLRQFHLLELEHFPSFDPKPNNHISLHVAPTARLLGPVNYWSTFAGERLNGKLGKINNNGKEGQMEITAIKAFCSSANFNSLLARSDVPELPNFINAAKQQIEQVHRGSAESEQVALAPSLLHSSPAKRTPITLSSPTYTSLLDLLNRNAPPSDPLYRTHLSLASSFPTSTRLDNRAHSLSRFSLNGNSCSPKHRGDSNVIVRLLDNGAVVERAGRVISVFAHERDRRDGGKIEEVFVEVDLWERVIEETVFDEWGKDTGTTVYRDRVEKRVLLPVESIWCHSVVHRGEVLAQLAEVIADGQVWNDRLIVVSLDRS